jgi:NAD(P)-dependent dehydrogenase (short-subunit alcohol dehydrogenase family)
MVADAGIATMNSIFQSVTFWHPPVRLGYFTYYIATVEELDRVFALNVRGTFLCYKYAAS